MRNVSALYERRTRIELGVPSLAVLVCELLFAQGFLAGRFCTVYAEAGTSEDATARAITF